MNSTLIVATEIDKTAMYQSTGKSIVLSENAAAVMRLNKGISALAKV